MKKTIGKRPIFGNRVWEKDALWSVLLSILVLLPNILVMFMSTDLVGMMAKMGYIVLSIFCFLIPALFLKSKPFFLVQFIVLIFSPIEIAHLLLNKMTLTQAYLASIIHTNYSEAYEVLSTMYLPLILYVVAIILYLFVVLRLMNNRPLFGFKIKITIVALMLSFVVMLIGYFYWENGKIYTQLTLKEKLENGIDNFGIKFYKIYPFDLYFQGKELLESEDAMDRESKKLATFSFGISKTKDTIPQTIVLVIGETARYGNFGINGYTKSTTPELQKMINLYSFNSIYSSTNVTYSSLPMILTRATPETKTLAQSEKSVLEAFAEAGYKTAWIANQSFSNRYVRRIASTADYTHFQPLDLDALDNYDGQLLPYLDNFIESNSGKNKFIVLHTLGSHSRYSARYPVEYEKFKPALRGNFDYSLINAENREELINSYDNTILYTDYILSQISKRISSKGESAAMLYLSDHAEDLLDDSRNLILHCNTAYSKWSFHIPYIVWLSPKYAALHPSRSVALLGNIDKQLQSTCTFYTLLQLGGITIPNTDNSRSLLNEQLEPDSTINILDLNMRVRRLELDEKYE